MTDMNGTFDRLFENVRAFLEGSGTRDQKLARVCYLLESTIDNYDWVGFYLVDPNDPEMLFLGPFAGEPTEHTRIPIGQGICGQALALRETFIVPDVTQVENYLSCGVDVRSEIVVPVMKDDRMIGELDIDSHELDAFTDTDRRFLEAVCVQVAKLF